VCACDDVIYIDTFKKLPIEKCEEDTLRSKIKIEKGFLALQNLKELVADNDQMQRIVKRIPAFKGLKIGLQKVPNLIIYNAKNHDNKIKIRTKESNSDKHLMDFLFSSSKKAEGNGVFSVNLTIVNYESGLHHCLTEYKLRFEEDKNGELERLIGAEIIGDTLVMF